MKPLVEGSTSPQRFSTLLLAIFAGLAVLLAAIGIYGVIAYSVVQRTREIGIRMALGAERSHVLRLELGQAVRIGMAGLVAGSVAAYIATRALAGMLFGVEPHDPVIFAGWRLPSAWWWWLPVIFPRDGRRGWTHWLRCGMSEMASGH